jgi:hypothetical protein
VFIFQSQPPLLDIGEMFLRTFFANPACVFLIILSGCASSNPVYKLYPGPLLQDSDLATVTLTHGDAISVDGLNVASAEYRTVHLMPGLYRIARGYHFSIVDTPQDVGDPDRDELVCDPELSAVILEAGRHYRVNAATTKDDKGLRMIDEPSGKVVWRCRAE